jgi:hypothetical protein
MVATEVQINIMVQHSLHNFLSALAAESAAIGASKMPG